MKKFNSMPAEYRPKEIENEVGVVAIGILFTSVLFVLFIGIVLWPEFKSKPFIEPQSISTPQSIAPPNFNASYTPPPVDTTSEAFRVEQKDRMIGNGATPADAEVFTQTLTQMEKEWKATGKVSP
jgi:cytoskeletal protein RodZ